MKILTDTTKPTGFPTSAAIGNFDGVHLGHKAILNHLRTMVKRDKTRSCVITFDPHPQKVIAKKDISLIIPFGERIELLEKEDIDCLVCLNFTKDLSLLSARDFVKQILVDFLDIKNIIVGPGFSFGYKRSGNIDLLKEMGKEFGFETMEAEPVTIDGEIVSSSKIRKHLIEGDVSGASKLLGYRYYLKGRVIEGEKRGREIGFPTVNLQTDWEIFPKPGVYATFAYVGDEYYRSITNIGYRPTFDKADLLIESHFFDFDSNIYDHNVRLEFIERVRDERKFNGVDSLVNQIKKDVKIVESILSLNQAEKE